MLSSCVCRKVKRNMFFFFEEIFENEKFSFQFYQHFEQNG